MLPKAQLQREQSVHLKVSGKQSYTEEEKEVLRQTSNINDNCFLPFMDVDLSERFQYAIPFEDRASELKLSSKQEKEFDCWIRPHEVSVDPKMIVGEHVDCYSIKQTVSERKKLKMFIMKNLSGALLMCIITIFWFF